MDIYDELHGRGKISILSSVPLYYVPFSLQLRMFLSACFTV